MTMTDRDDVRIVVLALLASGLVMIAPVLGRIGYVDAAAIAVAFAAACGLGSFLLAGLATVRAMRARPGSARVEKDAS